MFALWLALAVAACSAGTETTPDGRPVATPAAIANIGTADESTGAPTAEDAAPTSDGVPAFPTASLGLTTHRSDGNRFAEGRGAMPGAAPLDISLDGRPAWVVTAPYGDGGLWVVALEDGRVQAFRVVNRAAEPFPLAPESLPPGAPPMLLVRGDAVTLVERPSSASLLTHPVTLDPSGARIAFVDAAGDLVIWNEGEIARLAVSALPDARLLVDEAGRLLFLSEPTDRYAHGVLGDALEAGGITLLAPEPAPQVAAHIEIEPPSVIEGISPIWADLDGDGTREIIVTITNESEGARLVVFSEEGDRLAAGPAIGRGFRWRHQIAVAPFGPEGQLELAAVLTPHIGGRVEFYRLSQGQLQPVATLSGFSSHAIGSRNLDGGLAGDFDGDGQVELAVPDQSQQTLNGVRRTADGAELAWTVPVGARISSNIAAVTLPDGQLIVGAGNSEGILRIWVP